MLTVYTFGPAWGSLDMSPFVVKLMTWLRMADIPFQAEIGDVRKMPNRKLPAIRDNGQLMADSSVIIAHLTRKHGDPLNEARLDAHQCATARALQALLETDLYFVGLYLRWAVDGNFARFAPELAAYATRFGVPRLLQPLVVRAARRNAIGQLRGQGIGRHNLAFVNETGKSGYSALADYLGDKPFLFGDAPSAIDATLFAFLHTALVPVFSSAVKDHVRSLPNLLAYHDRLLAIHSLK